MSDVNVRIKLLQDLPFFGGICDEIVSLIIELSPVIEVAPGETFFIQDDSAKAMYVLEKGRAAVIKTWKSHKYLLRKMNAGDCFGEMALMDYKPRSASVYAIEACRAIEITPATLYKIFKVNLEQFAIIEMNMGREVCRRLRSMDSLIFDQKISEHLLAPDFDLSRL